MTNHLKKNAYIFYAAGICLATGLIAGFTTESSVNYWYDTFKNPDFIRHGLDNYLHTYGHSRRPYSGKGVLQS